jgi:2-methylisocitrate lyase-like PEP mutase family enzyme
VSGIAAAIAIPLNVDAEYCFADDPAGVAETVALIGQVGAAGCSIEDFNPSTGLIDSIERASERVAAAAQSAHHSGIVLTARAEKHLHGVTDLHDTIRRLCSYRDAGAEVVYAPGLADLTDVARLVDAVKVPFNFLLRPTGPSVPELASVAVRRVSTGGSLSKAAHGALKAAALELLNLGTVTFETIPAAELARAFDPGPVSEDWGRSLRPALSRSIISSIRT